MSDSTTAPMHTKSWAVRLDLYEEGDTTKARVVLHTGANVLEGRGAAHRNPGDDSVPEIGDEFAAGRALVDLGHRLLRCGTEDAGASAAEEGIVIHSR